jgi:hypothetical protein
MRSVADRTTESIIAGVPRVCRSRATLDSHSTCEWDKSFGGSVLRIARYLAS